jgi:hypothetical protein
MPAVVPRQDVLKLKPTRAAIDQILRQTIADPIGPEFMAPPATNAASA